MFEFRLPDIGEGLHEAEIVRWLVRPGDRVTEDQAVLEVQTDKATVELSSPVAGVIGELRAQEGEVVRVGSVLFTVLQDGDEPGSSPDGGAVAPVPNGVTQVSPPAPGETREAGPRRGKGRWAPATPSTRRLARALGVDVNALQGTGPGGRVTDEDVRRAALAVEAAARGGATAHGAALPAASFQGTGGQADVGLRAAAPPPQRVSSAGGATAPAPSPAPDGQPPGDERVPLRGIRRAIAQHMVRAKTLAPHAAAIDEADMENLIALRQTVNDADPARRMTYLPFIVKAVAVALRAFPHLNAHMDEEAQEIILRKSVHMGIATATADGLLVPVIRDVDRKSIRQIADELADLTSRARSRRLRPEELSGSTFTITNIGSVGSLLSVPIINHPEVAILGVHTIQARPVVRQDELVIRRMAYLCLSFDHRVIDGDVAARFLRHVIGYLEEPSRLLVEMV
ncbi:dihydrolipoamide acetyltransferase family protein [Caldinitratiruptor microaerophilus]|uniref:Dihydrolipoamide acetyltransferase component of pyruvate dehydrogenase complex n=1 Tax=Caldinitratiruptor microaerophilus TaxID=671077 RepID=A0AA35CIQ0_9FIRM|nr:dihydrolipoamide acetyltransferase family protein [Caldinitratiruptor microaerophilus]BDG59048.1 dihydrolipoamide acetyltransferase component of pyruvate dehydrogenase complex [Caldinitratiruptor microaerophilus]